MNRNYKKALKYRMPTDAEMEAMGCRYLTDEELEKLLASGINVYRHSDDLSDTGVNNVMKDAKDKYIAADGTVKDFTAMSKELAKQSNADKYFEYVYPGDDTRKMKTMSPDEFRSSNYRYGIGECYKPENDNRTGRPDHFITIINNPFTEHNSGIGTYDLERIRPLQPLSY